MNISRLSADVALQEAVKVDLFFERSNYTSGLGEQWREWRLKLGTTGMYLKCDRAKFVQRSLMPQTRLQMVFHTSKCMENRKFSSKRLSYNERAAADQRKINMSSESPVFDVKSDTRVCRLNASSSHIDAKLFLMELAQDKSVFCFLRATQWGFCTKGIEEMQLLK